MPLTRYVIASFIAPIAMLLIPSIFAIYELNDVVQLPDGSFDDGAMRGAGVFLTIGLPICYLIASCYYAAIAHILVRLKRLTLKTSLWVAGLAPWLLILLAAAGLISNNRSILLGLLMLFIIGLFMSLFTILGAAVWWFIAIPRALSNPSIKRDA